MEDFGLTFDDNDGEYVLPNEDWKNHFIHRSSEHDSWIRIAEDSELSAISHLFAKGWIPVENPSKNQRTYTVDVKRLTPGQIMQFSRILSPKFGSVALTKYEVKIPVKFVADFQRI